MSLNFLATLQQHCRPDRLRLDCGANLGGYTHLMRESHPGVIHAFEPVPGMYRKLYDRFGFVQDVRCWQLGVGERSEERSECSILEAWSIADPRVHPRNYSQGALALAGMHQDDRFSMRLVSLDAWLATLVVIDTATWVGTIPSVDFLKLDVDGYEPAALRGAKAILLRDRPTILLELGYHCQDMGESVTEFLNRIYDEYRYVLLTEDGVRRDRSYWDDHYPYHTSFDVAMVPQEWEGELVFT